MKGVLLGVTLVIAAAWLYQRNQPLREVVDDAKDAARDALGTIDASIGGGRPACRTGLSG